MGGLGSSRMPPSRLSFVGCNAGLKMALGPAALDRSQQCCASWVTLLVLVIMGQCFACSTGPSRLPACSPPTYRVGPCASCRLAGCPGGGSGGGCGPLCRRDCVHGAGPAAAEPCGRQARDPPASGGASPPSNTSPHTPAQHTRCAPPRLGLRLQLAKLAHPPAPRLALPPACAALGFVSPALPTSSDSGWLRATLGAQLRFLLVRAVLADDRLGLR